MTGPDRAGAAVAAADGAECAVGEGAGETVVAGEPAAADERAAAEVRAGAGERAVAGERLPVCVAAERGPGDGDA